MSPPPKKKNKHYLRVYISQPTNNLRELLHSQRACAACMQFEDYWASLFHDGEWKVAEVAGTLLITIHKRHAEWKLPSISTTSKVPSFAQMFIGQPNASGGFPARSSWFIDWTNKWWKMEKKKRRSTLRCRCHGCVVVMSRIGFVFTTPK